MPARILLPAFLFLLSSQLHGAAADAIQGCDAWRSRVASNGRTFYGAWTVTHYGFSDINGSVNGEPLSGSGVLTADEETVAAWPGLEGVASDGTGYLVATNFEGAFTAQLVDGNGLLQGAPISLATGFPDIIIGGPAIDSSVGASWNGAHYVVAGAMATKNSDQSIHEALLAATIGANGEVIATRIIADGTSLLDLKAAGGGRTLVLMLAHGTVQSMLMEDSLATTPPVNVVTRGDIQAALASSGTGFLAVWQAGTTIEALALDANGSPAGTPFAVTQVPAAILTYATPAVAWDGSGYLVAWWASSLFGARSDGRSATSPFVIAADGTYPSLAANANGDIVTLFATGCGTMSSRIVPKGALGTPPHRRAVAR